MNAKISALSLLVALILGACDGGQKDARAEERPAPVPSQTLSAGSEEEATAADVETGEPADNRVQNISNTLPPGLREWTGDLDGMIERRVIRVLTVYGPGSYFIEGGQEKGPTYEAFRLFEEKLNTRLGSEHLRVYVVLLPVSRDQLIQGLIDGKGDIAAAALTITPEREALVDFTDPISKELNEILVTGPKAPQIHSLEDLSGLDISARESSSYFESLVELNKRLESAGLEPLHIHPMSELLEDDDMLEMVHSGLLPFIVVDDYSARQWTGALENLVLRDDLVLRKGGRLGWAFRKNSPQLAAELNAFVNENRQGTLTGNILINRYFRDKEWTKDSLAPQDIERFRAVRQIFEKYGEMYGFDYLLVAAQGYQESGLDQSVRSHVGAVGIMQLLPSTAADPNVGIPDITEVDANIHAGVKYLRFIRDRYFPDSDLDRLNASLFAFASYNAGPARVAGLRKKAAAQGLDPNRWFDNVEVVAAREIGHETVQYVANIFKYYLAYRLSMQSELRRGEAREEAGLDES